MIRCVHRATHSGKSAGSRPTGTATRVVAVLVVAMSLGACASTSQRAANEAGEQDVLSGIPVPESADEARSLARQAYGAGDLDGALYMLVQAVRLDPEDAQSLYSIGAIHETKGNTELAARAYSQAVEIDPSHALAQQQHGSMLMKAGDLRAARKALQIAIDNDSTLWRPHDLLGVIADMEERYKDAIAHYSAAIALRPTAASIVNNRGYSKYLAGMIEAAEADFRLALEIDASHQRAWQNLGLIYARQKKYDEARWAMEMYMPKHVAANDIGYVAMLDGEFERAALLFEEAIRLSPRYYPTAEANMRELERRRPSNQVLSLGNNAGNDSSSPLQQIQVEPEPYTEADAETGSPQAAVTSAATTR